MKRIWLSVIAVITVFALMVPAYLYVEISHKGGSTEDCPISINASQDISIRISHPRGTSSYFTWDDGQKLAFDSGFIFSNIITQVPKEPGIHKLTITKDAYFFKVPTTYYYLIE